MKLLAKALMLFMFLSFTDVNDEYISDYAKVVESYKKQECLSYQIQYKSFDTSSIKADTALLGFFEFKGNQFRSKLAGTESIRNEKYYLTVDHNNKLMYLTNAKNMKGNFLPTSGLDTLMKKTGMAVKKGAVQDNHTKRYLISYPEANPTFNGISIDIDINTYYLNKITFLLKPRENVYEETDWKYIDQPFLEMIYSKYSTTAIDPRRFSLESFVTINNGHDAVLATRYKTYTFINSISISKQIR
jgi:hypothetical protein